MYGLGTSAMVAAVIFINPVFLLVVAMQPIPSEEYIWEKGNYRISAVGRNDALVKYENRIINWEWEDKNISSK